MEFEEKTTFLGLRISEAGPSNDFVKKALGYSLKYLEIETFMNVIGFEQDPVMTGYFWHVLVDNHCRHLATVLLECLGYEGTYNKQQFAIKRFLKSNRIEYSELLSNDPQIELYPTIKEEMKNLKPNVIACRKWLIIEPREFKKVIMKLNTKNGDKIREYYIRLEELIKLYFEYSLYFKERDTQIEKQKSQLQIESLEKKIDQMRLDAEERHDELLDRVEEVQYDLNVVGEKLEIAVEDRS